MFEGGVAGALSSVPGWLQIVGLVSVLAGSAAALNGRLDAVEDSVATVEILPQRVDALEDRVEVVQLSIDRVDGKVDRLLCMSEASRGEHGYEQCVD